MKKLFSKLFIVGALGMFAMSCSSDDNETITPPDTTEDIYDARINNFASDSLNATVFLSDIDDNVIDVLLSFSSTESMKRMYVTKNVFGQGEEKVDVEAEFGVNPKGDGAIDLSADLANDLAFYLKFNTTGLPTSGTIVYKFWTTTGKGDFRDNTKRLAEGPATLTIDLGGTNPSSVAVTEYSTTILAAPLADGSSNTFVSLLDGQVYKINQGEEYSALWDFGYYYGATLFASLAAADNYPSSIIDVPSVAGTTELNSCFFATSTMDFDAVTKSSDLNSIATPTSERINDLQVGDIIEFVDNYGKKGLIKVSALTAGNGTDGKITLDIKVQP